MTRRSTVVLALLAALAVVLPAAPGAAAAGVDAPGAAAVGGPGVEVAALVERPGGRLAVERSRAATAAEGRALAARLRARPGVVAADVSVPVRAFDVPPPDPRQGEQWGLPATSTDAAWALGDATGEVVAVIDSGVDAGHPDLQGALVRGRDILDGDDVPQDDNGHGTHVTGIVAAVAGNGVGVAGAALRAKAMPIRVLDAEGFGSSGVVAEGIVWAVDNGATVVNLSLGGPKSESVLERAISYALSRGVPVVAAAGNDALRGDPVNYPAAHPGVIAVGAVDRNGTRPSFSSTGTHLAVAGPGVGVLSTTRGARYGFSDGTSMAAPFVASAVAIVRAASPAMPVADVRSLLMATAVDLGPAGHDREYGAGLIDVRSALSAVVPNDGAYDASTAAVGQLDLVARGPYGQAVHRTWTSGGGSSAATSLGGLVRGAPSSATRSGRLEVVARGGDDQVWARARATDGSWATWRALGGRLTSRPSAATSPGGRLDVVARGGDGAVWHRSSTTPDSWSGWQSLGGGLLPGTAPAVVWTSSGRLELLAVGTDRQVWRRSMTASGWSGWSPLGGRTDADVAAASTGTGSLTVVVRGGDRAAWRRTLGSSGDSGWTSLGGALSGGPSAAAVPSAGRLDVVVPGLDGRPYVNTSTSAGWSGWRRL